MAKKIGTKKKGKKGGGKKKSTFNTSKLMGMAGAIFGDVKFLDKFLTDTVKIEDPKMKAAAKIIIGQYAPQQDFVKNFMKDQDILVGGGDALTTLGIKDLMTAMNISGMGADDSTELAVAIEGIDDVDMDEDVLGDDIDTVNEDVLGDDDFPEDIDTVNDDEDY